MEDAAKDAESRAFAVAMAKLGWETKAEDVTVLHVAPLVTLQFSHLWKHVKAYKPLTCDARCCERIRQEQGKNVAPLC